MTLMNPLGHPLDACARMPREARHCVPLSDQGATQSPADEAVCARYQDAAHTHFQPKRLKNLNADIENIRM